MVHILRNPLRSLFCGSRVASSAQTWRLRVLRHCPSGPVHGVAGFRAVSQHHHDVVSSAILHEQGQKSTDKTGISLFRNLAHVLAHVILVLVRVQDVALVVLAWRLDHLFALLGTNRSCGIGLAQIRFAQRSSEICSDPNSLGQAN